MAAGTAGGDTGAELSSRGRCRTLARILESVGLKAWLGAVTLVGLGIGCESEPKPIVSQGSSPASDPVRKGPDVQAARPIQQSAACLGTQCTLLAYGADELTVRLAFESALAEVQRLDRLMTTWLPDSDVSRINAAAGNGQWVSVAMETLEVLDKSLWMAKQSDGAFDITVGAFRGLWKFDQDKDGSIPSTEAVSARLALVNYRDLELSADRSAARLRRPGQRITLGGIAKGYIVDCVVNVLNTQGLVNFVFRAGGDLYAAGKRGDRPWRVGIQDPRSSQQGASDDSFALLALSDKAFNTSGDYERFVLRDGRRYHHILDPRDGQPVAHTRSVTVLAPTAFMADTLDTALLVMGAERAMALVESLPEVEAVVVDGSNRVFQSSGLQGQLTLVRAPSDGI